MLKRPLLILFLITQMICRAPAQQTKTVGTPPPAPPPTTQSQRPDSDDVVKITTNLVQVDAVVADKNGKLITDLKQEEVELYEDSKRQQVTHFSWNAGPVKTAEPKAEPLKQIDPALPSVPVPLPQLKREDVHRSMAIVVDDLGMSFESIAYVRRALRKFIDEQMQVGDIVSVVRTGGGAGALQQFTSDKRQLYAAIERVRFNLLGRADSSAFSALKMPDLHIPDEAESKVQSAENYRAEVYSVGTLGTLRYVVQGLRDMPGRKSVLLLSDDLKIFSPGDTARTNRVQVALEALANLANRASVVIYTMDARGLTTTGLQAQDNVQMAAPVGRPGMAGPLGGTRTIKDVEAQMALRRESFFESQNGLNFLAEQTGGLAIRNTNNLSGGMQRVMDDQQGYYLIGYRPDESTFDPKTGRSKFHHLTIKVTRPGKFDVRTRNGFFGVSNEETKPTEQSAAELLLKAISSPFGSAGVRLQLTSLFANDVTNGSLMRSLLHIDARDLTFKDGANGTHQCVFDLLAMTFGENGAAVDYNAQTYTIELPDTVYQQALQQGLVYSVSVPLKKAGAYQFRISLRDTASDRIGSAGQFIEVPDLMNKRLALSGIVLSGLNDLRDAGASASAAGAAYRNNPAASPAVRHFKQGMFLEYGLLIYNARLDKTGKPQLKTVVRLFRDGQPVFAGDPLPFNANGQTDPGRLSVRGALQIGSDLVPGEYVFQMVVLDMLADGRSKVATQWMDFEVVK